MVVDTIFTPTNALPLETMCGMGVRGTPPDRPTALELGFSTKEVLLEEVKIYGPPDHGCVQTG